jgi:hypothetical protein
MYLVLASIVLEGNRYLRQLPSIQLGPCDAVAGLSRIVHRDSIGSFSVDVAYAEAGPLGGNCRIHDQSFPPEFESEHLLNPDPIHPCA